MVDLEGLGYLLSGFWGSFIGARPPFLLLDCMFGFRRAKIGCGYSLRKSCGGAIGRIQSWWLGIPNPQHFNRCFEHLVEPSRLFNGQSLEVGMAGIAGGYPCRFPAPCRII